MKKYSYCILLMALCLFSCVEDEGNYDLNPVNRVTIEGLDEDGYSVMSNVDVLNIDANVIGTINEKNDADAYEYQWVIKNSEGKRDTVSTDRVLNYEVTLAPGTYTLYFEVYDKTSELKWSEYTYISVSTEMSRGFLILGDGEDGYARLDMIATISGKDTVVMKDILLPDYIKESAETINFAGSPAYGGGQTLWLTTENSSYPLTSGSYFDVLPDKSLNDIMLTDFNVKRPMRILDMYPHQYSGGTSRCKSSRGYITDDAIYVASLMSGTFFGNPINRYTSTSDELFKPYPVAFHHGNTYMSSSYVTAIYYDMTNKRFAGHNSAYASSVTNCIKLSDKDGDPFPWNQEETGRDLVYGQIGYSTMGYNYALMKDNNNNWFIYRFIVPARSATPTKNGGWEIDLSIATNFDKASAYVFSSTETEILYAVGSELWGYDYERKIAAKLKDFGNEIIMLKADGDSKSSDKNDFFVVTALESHKSTICKIEMVDNPNAVEMEEMEDFVFTIDSKVKAIYWKSATDQSTMEDYF